MVQIYEYPMLPLFKQSNIKAEKVAILDNQTSFTYAELNFASDSLAHEILGFQNDLNETPVVFLVDPGFEYVATQWAIWKAGGIAVPLSPAYPADSIQYILEDTNAQLIIAHKTYKERLEQAANSGIKIIYLEDIVLKNTGLLPTITLARKALILYTSGTTGKPKGVVTTHKNIDAQINSLCTAWQWTAKDHILCTLPLHHIHGIINVISCALYSGATVTFSYPFSAEKIFSNFLQSDINLFMAVPTIYYKLIGYLEEKDEDFRQKIKTRLQQFRLMVSGSAALPVSTMEKWEQLSGHKLLERYGMTEIGMAISNPYDGERKAGYIGQALPGVQIRLVNDEGEVVGKETPGEIQIKGANVFLAYWQKEEATAEAFTEDGWFKSGDVGIFENGSYRIMGRSSVDIIKSGGYKISALEIEEILRTHESIKDCAVVGIPDEEWGEIVAAGIIPEGELEEEALKVWMKNKMPAYRVPRRLIFGEDLPRNAMGKVTKNELKKLF